jgi:2-methylcitrate dehydratase PrpD
MAANPLDALVRHVATTVSEDVPPAAVVAAKTFILDTFACGIAGSGVAESARIHAAAAAWGAGDDARAWGRAGRLPAPSAALVNAYQIHCLEFDCVHEGGVLHPMSALFAAAMAEAERQGRRGRAISGRDLIAAVAVGVDVSCNLALSSRAPMRFFRPASIGGFGATAASARLRGFDASRTAAALGIMYGQTSGTMQPHVEGSSLLGLQVGFAARSALVATDLAAAGIDGPRNIITGPWGYLPLFEGEHDIGETWDSWGRVWRLTEIGHKPYPSGRLTHYAIEALQEMRGRLGFGAEDVEAVVCCVPPLPFRLVGRPDLPDPSPNYAKLCLAYVCATLLRRGTVAPEDFAPTALADAETHRLAARVSVEADDSDDPNAFGPQTVTLRLKNGTVETRTVAYAIGDPRNPLPRDRQLAKFRWCWDVAASRLPRSRGEILLELLDDLEKVPDVTALVDALTPA